MAECERMMTEIETSSRSTTPLQGHLARVSDMLNRHRLVERLAHGEAHQHHEVVDELVHRQNLAELQREIDKLHPADVAHILDALPPEDRLSVWHLVKADRDGEILLEVSDAVRETLLADMDAPEILAAAEQLDADELADLAEDLPDDVVHELMQRLDAPEREQLRSAMSYEEDQVGAIMDFEMITIREDVTLEVVLRYLRFLKEIPEQTDKLFVVNNENVLTGVVPLKWLLVNDPARWSAMSWRSTPTPSIPMKTWPIRPRPSNATTSFPHPSSTPTGA